jgi:hypothetical protein
MLLENHKTAFIMGSILPDCKPSFVTTKHNMDETFEMVTQFISELTVDTSEFKRISTAYCRKLGEVTHYLADYFTYPHNDTFDGNMKAHCLYEKDLKHALKEYIQSEEIFINRKLAMEFETPEELCNFVIALHNQYTKGNKTVELDSRYIVALCHIVVAGILHLMEKNRIANVA